PQLASFRAAQPATHRALASEAARPARQAAPQGSARLSTPAALVVRPWTANSSNVQSVQGRVTLDGPPGAGARVTVDEYAVPQPTAGDGTFHYDLDYTVPGRHEARVTGAAAATVDGRQLTPGQRAALLSATGGFRVGYAVTRLSAHVQNGKVVV